MQLWKDKKGKRPVLEKPIYQAFAVILRFAIPPLSERAEDQARSDSRRLAKTKRNVGGKYEDYRRKAILSHADQLAVVFKRTL